MGNYHNITINTIGESDHNMVFVRPKYLPIVQRMKPKTLLVKNLAAVSRLLDAFECTDWNVLLESAVNINELAELVVQHMKFCMDYCIQTKRCEIYSNNKPWITKHIKGILSRKKQIFFKIALKDVSRYRESLGIKLKVKKRNIATKLKST